MSRPLKLKQSIKCIICNKIFFVWPYELKRGKKCCSKKCFKKNKYKHKTIDPRGYILLYTPYHPFAKGKGYVYEHRLVMEKHLKRYLKSNELIHHIDNNPQNNNIKNLLLTTKKEHKKIHKEIGKNTRFTSKQMYKYWHKKKPRNYVKKVMALYKKND